MGLTPGAGEGAARGESRSGQRQRLNLTAEEVEVLAHMTMKRGASSDELVRDVWLELSSAAGLGILGGQNSGVCLEFSGGLSQARPVDVVLDVGVDGAKSVA